MIANTKISIFIMTSLMISTASAGDGPGTSAVNFLNIGVSARSAATGGAFSAVSDGPVSSYYNPAGLTRTENMQIAGMHSEWLGDLRYEYLGFASPVGRNGGLGISFSYLSYGGFDGYNAVNEPTGNVSAYDLSAGFSYGQKITSELSIGLGLKSVGEKLDNIQAFGIAGDFGLQYDFGYILTGLSIMNFGPKLKYETSSSPLPTTVDAGISFRPYNSDLMVMAGAIMPLSGSVAFKGGLEYSYQNMLALRTGYDSEDNFDSKSGLSFGGGLNLSTHSLDYAYNVNTIFGGTHQISFVFRFGRQRASANYDNDVKPADETAIKVQPEPTPDRSKAKYLICAAKYGDRESATKHIKTLKKFSLSARLLEHGEEQFWVVLKEVKGREKAEKSKMDFEKQGITCFIEEP